MEMAKQPFYHFFHGNDLFSHPSEKSTYKFWAILRIIPKPECFGPDIFGGILLLKPSTFNGSIWGDTGRESQVASPFAQIVVIK